MIRIVCDPGQRVGNQLTLSLEQIHYLEHVMRQKAGDPIEVHIVDEGVYQAYIVGSGQAQLDPTPAPTRRLPSHVRLYQSLLKKDHFAEVVERGTEAGIQEFIPLVTERSIVREVTPNRQQRWLKIANEATEQSRRPDVPRIHPLVSLQEMTAPSLGLGLILDPSGLPLREAVIEDTPQEVSLVVGPEGGLTPGERELLLERGFTAVSLGPQIFRAENAGAFATVMLFALWMR